MLTTGFTPHDRSFVFVDDNQPVDFNRDFRSFRDHGNSVFSASFRVTIAAAANLLRS
jgi:hypothetical protein